MNNAVGKLALVTLPSLALASPLAMAAGQIEVYNESPQLIQPYFKSNCWGYALSGMTGWVFFGNIGPDGGRFTWDFSDPALTDPACADGAVIQFTYGTNFVAPPDPQVGNRRAATHFSLDTNTVFQIGKSLYAKELEGPTENGR